MAALAYVNERFLPLEQACVSVEDRGYQFADAVYEVLRTYGGRPFAVAEHLDRLWRNLEAIELQHPFSRDQLAGLIEEGIHRAGFAETMVYLQISRGVAKRHRAVPAQYRPNLVMTFRELENSDALRQSGIRVITVADQRWGRCDIKSVALLPNVLAYQAARRAGAQDAIFVEADGTVQEATAGNVFLVRAGRLITPPLGPRLLAGVTRDKVVRWFGAVEQRVSRDELYGADEIFLTSTTAEVVPVVAVDARPVGEARPGPVTGSIYAEFRRRVAEAMAPATRALSACG
jgi:D-alanine transaminase